MSIFKEWESETAADWVVIPPISEKNDANEKVRKKSILVVRNDYNKNRDPKSGRFAPALGKYRQADTVEAANKNAGQILANAYENNRTANNLQLVPLAEFGNEVFSSDYGKCSVATANAFNEQIADLCSRFNTSLQIVAPMSGAQRLANKDIFAGVTHDYTVAQSTLWINDRKCAELGNMIARTKANSDSGYWIKVADGKESKYVPTHEFAHSLMTSTGVLSQKTNFAGVDYKKVKAARKEIKEVYERHVKELIELKAARDAKAEQFNKIDINKDAEAWVRTAKELAELNKQYSDIKVSDYALTNADEFMAECFTDAEIGANPSKYSKEVHKILTKYYGR